MRYSLLLSFSSISLLVAACSSGGGATGTGGTTTTSTGGTTSTTHSTSSTTTHMNQCVLTTDKGNNNGVGAYCTPGGNECSNFPLAGICLADVGQSEWFCTRIGCQKDADCGAMATCDIESGGSACVPNKCLQGSGDGGTGTDGGGDAG